MSSSIVFLKCYFCQKSYNKNGLIDMSGSSVMINEEKVEFRNLIFDTCFVRVGLMELGLKIQFLINYTLFLDRRDKVQLYLF